MEQRFCRAIATIATFASLALLTAPAFAAGKPAKDAHARGRYLVEIGGCNDCHTPGYAMSGGKVPEKQWLVGDGLVDGKAALRRQRGVLTRQGRLLADTVVRRLLGLR